MEINLTFNYSRFFFPNKCALIRENNLNVMLKIILVGIIVVLVYSQTDLRLTIADWLRTASDFLIESVKVEPKKLNE